LPLSEQIQLRMSLQATIGIIWWQKLLCRDLDSDCKKLGTKKYENGHKLVIHEDVFDFPLKIKEPRMIFVN